MFNETEKILIYNKLILIQFKMINIPFVILYNFCLIFLKSSIRVCTPPFLLKLKLNEFRKKPSNTANLNRPIKKRTKAEEPGQK